MKAITEKQVKRIYTMIGNMNLRDEKENMVFSASLGRTSSVKSLSFTEAEGLIKSLLSLQGSMNRNSSDKMRKKIIAICHDLGWKEPGSNRIDMDRVNDFLLKRGKYKKKLNHLTKDELAITIEQMERIRDSYKK